MLHLEEKSPLEQERSVPGKASPLTAPFTVVLKWDFFVMIGSVVVITYATGNCDKWLAYWVPSLSDRPINTVSIAYFIVNDQRSLNSYPT